MFQFMSHLIIEPSHYYSQLHTQSNLESTPCSMMTPLASNLFLVATRGYVGSSAVVLLRRENRSNGIGSRNAHY